MVVHLKKYIAHCDCSVKCVICAYSSQGVSCVLWAGVWWRPLLWGRSCSSLLVLDFIVLNQLFNGSISNSECPGCEVSIKMNCAACTTLWRSLCSEALKCLSVYYSGGPFKCYYRILWRRPGWKRGDRKGEMGGQRADVSQRDTFPHKFDPAKFNKINH